MIANHEAKEGGQVMGWRQKSLNPIMCHMLVDHVPKGTVDGKAKGKLKQK